MNYNEQEIALNQRVPKYKDVSTYILSKNNQNVYGNSSSHNTILFPIAYALFKMHQHYQKRQFEIHDTVWGMSTTKTNLENYPDIKQLVDYVCNTGEENYNELFIINISRNAEIFEKARTHEKYNKDLSLALQTAQTHKIAVIVPSDSQTVIFTNKQNLEAIQTYYSIVPIVYPKENLPEELIASFLALYNTDYDKIYDNLNALFENIDISEIKLKELEKNLFNIFQSTNDTSRIDKEIETFQAKLQDYYSLITSTMQLIKQKEMQKLMLWNADASEKVKILIDYLQNNKLISDFYVINNKLNVTIKTPLFFVDEEYVDRLLKTEKSYLGPRSSDMKQFIKEAFIDKTIKLVVQATLSMDPTALTGYSDGKQRNFYNIITALPLGSNSAFTDTVPHPHLVHFNCFGGNETHILKAAEHEDHIGVIAQGIAACQNINFGDQMVCNRFLNNIEQGYKEVKFILDEKTNERISYSEWVQRRNNETN